MEFYVSSRKRLVTTNVSFVISTWDCELEIKNLKNRLSLFGQRREVESEVTDGRRRVTLSRCVKKPLLL